MAEDGFLRRPITGRRRTIGGGESESDPDSEEEEGDSVPGSRSML